MLRVERVTGRAHGADHVGEAAFVLCLAKAADMDVDGAFVDVGIVRPDGVEQTLAREDSAGTFEEVAQQAELGRAELHRPSGATDTMRLEVHLDVRVSELLAE